MAPIERVVVVLGAHAPEIQAADLDPRMEFIVNDDWREGNAGSLRAGLRATPDADAWIVTLGDQPFLPASVVDTFRDRPGLARATYAGEPGHPVRLDLAAAERILAGAEPRRSLRDAQTIEVGHLFNRIDIDTPEDLEAARHEARAVLLR